MPRETVGNKWIARTTKYLREHGHLHLTTGRRQGSYKNESVPIVGSNEGNYMSVVDKNLNPVCRAPSTIAWMKDRGLDPIGPSVGQQIQFTHKASAKAFKDVVAACVSTQEEAISVWVEQTPSPVLCVLKAYPVGDHIFCVCIDVTKLGTVVANDFAEEIETYFPEMNITS